MSKHGPISVTAMQIYVALIATGGRLHYIYDRWERIDADGASFVKPSHSVRELIDCGLLNGDGSIAQMKFSYRRH